MSTRHQALRTTILCACVGLHALMVLAVLAEPVPRGETAGPPTVLARAYHDVAHTAGPGADFFALYHAGVNASRGTSVFDDVTHRTATPYFYPYRYLPGLAHTFGRALTLLPPRAAYVTWVFVSELVLLVLLVGVWRALAHSWLAWGASAVLLLAAPYWLELYMGQFTFVAASLACLAILRRQDGSQATSGALLWAAAWLKVYPLVVVPALFRTRRGGLLTLAVLGAALVPNIPLLLGDPAAADAFWGKNFVGEPRGLDAGNHGLLFVVYLVGQAIGGEWNLPLWGAFSIVWRAVVLMVAAIVVLTAARPQLPTAAATLLLAHFVSYFQVWEHHMSGAIVAGVLLCIGLHGSGDRWQARAALTAVALLALPTPFFLLPHDPAAWNLAQRLAPPLAKAVPLVLLFALGMRSVGAGDVAAAGRRHPTP
jgi:hypothetical protein